ncbi:MAG: ORF6N domain-containing protein [Nitrospirae bacterium]|nr:ORF6N domain-containing protein [Nitrospirota bacterium]
MDSIVTIEMIEKKIFLVRSKKVMLDSDLAELYEVETRTLVQAVKRNIGRFPPDFMFQLNNQEDTSLRSQFVISKYGKGGRRYTPYVFTEQGVAMLSSVLNSERAVHVNIAIMRAFVKLLEMISSHKDLSKRLSEIFFQFMPEFPQPAFCLCVIGLLYCDSVPKFRCMV